MEAIHTTNVEEFSNIILKYLPKRDHLRDLISCFGQ